MKVNVKPLNIKAEKIEGIWGKVRGLMFSKKRNLLFVFDREQVIDLHMLFVFYPIIVAWLDKKKRITKMVKMYPFLSLTGGRGKYVLEIPYDEKIFKRMRSMKSLRF
jgi:uncharacterized protein